MEGTLTLSNKEQKRSMGLNETENGKMGLGETAEILGISPREGCS
jgi:hypothetical protein